MYIRYAIVKYVLIDICICWLVNNKLLKRRVEFLIDRRLLSAVPVQ